MTTRSLKAVPYVCLAALTGAMLTDSLTGYALCSLLGLVILGRLWLDTHLTHCEWRAQARQSLHEMMLSRTPEDWQRINDSRM